jgi:hypothetical protein
MAITPLPAVPLRSDAPATFVTKADAFLGALNLFATEVDAVGVALTLGATNSTSTTSLLIGVGSKSLTVQTGKSYVAGMTLKIASTASPSNWMLGDITSYVTGTGALVINITSILGSGTVAAWTVSQSAPGGAAIGANADITSLSAITAIKFPAAQVASANANTLDDYEEGTYTPVLSFEVGAATVTYTANLGHYTKIGNLVTVQARIDLATWAVGTASGQLRVSLPTAVGNVGNVAFFVGVVYAGGFADSQPMISLATNNAAYCILYSTATATTTNTGFVSTSTTGSAPVTAAQVLVTSVIYMSITYTV